MSLLLHACCAPCLTYSIKAFKEEFDEVTALWFNPNIHPFEEYRKRFEAMEKFEEEKDIDIIYLDKYELKSFLEGALKSDPRCEFCYEWRFSKTAKIAQEKGFEYFSTTLTISPYQNHEMIKKVGKKESEKKNIEFIYRDLRDGFSKHHELSNEMGLYKQGYCGCIFSEKERYYEKLRE